MTRIGLCPRGPVGACASSGCGTRRGDCGAVCPGMLMQCPGAHTQVPASLPHFLKTAPSRAGIRSAAGRAAQRWLLRDPRCGASAAQRGPQAPQGRGAPGVRSGLCRGPLLRRSRGRLGRFSSTLRTSLSKGRGGRKRLRRSGPGPGGGRRVRVRAPSRPGSRQRRQPARGSSARRGQPVRKVRTNGWSSPSFPFPRL